MTKQKKKSKTTAVVLAVLFGVLAWVYTYKDDAWKFWLNFLLTIVTCGIWGIFAYVWVIIDMAIREKEYFEDYYSED